MAPGKLDDRARERVRAWLDDLDADLDTLARIALAMGLTIASLLDVPQDPLEAELLGIFRSLDAAARVVGLQALAMMRQRTELEREPEREPGPRPRLAAPLSNGRKAAGQRTPKAGAADPRAAGRGKPAKRETLKR